MAVTVQAAAWAVLDCLPPGVILTVGGNPIDHTRLNAAKSDLEAALKAPPSPETAAENARCVRFIRALVREWRKTAARVHEDGEYTVSDLHFTRPFWRRTTHVRPRYAEYSKHILECAGALEKYIGHFERGGALKPEFDTAELDAGVPTDATEPKPWE